LQAQLSRALLLFIGFPLFLSGQEPEPAEELINIDPDIAQFVQPELLDDRRALLTELREVQVDIHSSEIELLAIAGLLDQMQINAIIEHVNRYGRLLCLEELQCIDLLQTEDIRRIRPYIKLDKLSKTKLNPGKLLARSIKNIRLMLKADKELRKGYLTEGLNPPAYTGNRNTIRLRFTSRYASKFKSGLLLEKDAGEAMGQGWQTLGFDHMNLYLHLKNGSRILKDFVVGDFRVSMGQGLIEHSAFNTGKSINPGAVIKTGRQITTSNSLDENRGYRGIAACFDFGKVELMAGLSRKNIDARIEGDSTHSYIKSFQYSGYHRTESERASRKKVARESVAFSCRYEGRRLQLSLNNIFHRYNYTYNPEVNSYNKYQLRGWQHSNHSIDFRFRKDNKLLFGELAVNGTGGQAFIIGSMLALSRRTALSLVFRQFQRNYSTLFGNALGESSSASNESGLFMAFNTYLGRGFSLSANADMWHNGWLQYQVHSPSIGHETSIRLAYQKSKVLFSYVQFQNERKSENGFRDKGINEVIQRHRYRVRLHTRFKTDASIEWRIRGEMSAIQRAGEWTYGHLLYQEILYRKLGSPLSLTLRTAVFNTDDYDTRIYAYEYGMLNDARFLAYSGKGVRYYIHMRYKLTSGIMMEAIWLRTRFLDRDEVSSGNQLITRPLTSQFGLQIAYSF